MTFSEEQLCLSPIYKEMEGFASRRAYISTQYAIWRDVDKAKAETFRLELSSIDQQAILKFAKLRKAQSRYLVEYEAETIDADTGRLTDRNFREELYFLVNCNLDTFSNGWDWKADNVEELITVIHRYLLQYKGTRCLILNVKQISPSPAGRSY